MLRTNRGRVLVAGRGERHNASTQFPVEHGLVDEAALGAVFGPGALVVVLARKAGHLDTRCDCVTFAQRLGSALNLNPHFHTLMLDGVYTYAEGNGAPLFVPAPPLTDIDFLGLRCSPGFSRPMPAGASAGAGLSCTST